ncbi:hypothetical protein Plec18170_004357 [Paecilomyces lecythidis]
MSLKSIYERFLADPASAPLASDVSLIYITTTTTVNEAGAVLKHLSNQQRIVKKKAEKVIGVVEGSDSLCLDVETTLEFVDGGGAYLPSLDDNFLIDHVATFPTIHIVRFNAQQEIQQIRLYWDQGSLLKQVEVIGARSRSWPIRDAKDQLRLISSAASGESSGLVTPPNGSEKKTAPKEEQDQDTKVSPIKKRIKDPYAAESLFELLSPGQDRMQKVVAPRAAATGKPPPRDYSELFVGEDDDIVPAQSTPSRPVAPKIGSSKHYKPSPLFVEEDGSATQEEQKPTKPIAPKAGSSKNFKPSRVFIDEEEEPVEEKEPKYKTHPKKFSHFEMGDGDDEVEQQSKPIPSRPKSQHVAQWGFEDFVTPEKPKPKIRPSDTRHFAWSDDEVDAQDTPPARPHVAQPRRDAETHFQLQHDDIEEEIKPRRALGSAHNNGLGLYENNLYDEEGNPTPQPERKAPLAIVPNGTHRKKDFDSHWSITDADPAEEEQVSHENKKPIAHDKMKHIKHMEASWAAYDESPEQKVAAKPKRMSRNVLQPSWTLGDEDEGF